MCSRIWIVAIVLAFVLPCKDTNAQGPTACSLPANVAQSAKLSMVDVVSVLAHQGCSGGAIVSDQDNWPHPDLVETLTSQPIGQSISITDTSKIRPNWRVSAKKTGVVRLAPASTNICESVLERRLAQVNYAGKAFEIEAALHDFLKGREPRPSGDVPVVGSFAPKDAQAIQIWDQPISLNLADVSLEEALDATVSQVSGLFWVLREANTSATEAGCYLSLQAATSAAQGGDNLLPHKLHAARQ